MPAFALTFSWRCKQRSWHVTHLAGLVVTVLLLLLALWYAAATAYFIFHDQLVASLISHQVDVQYSYEDRIAALQTQLDREASRGLLDRQTLATKIRDLTSKSQALEARAVAIDTLVHRFQSGAFSSTTDVSVVEEPARAATEPLQSEKLGRRTIDEDHADLAAEHPDAQLLATLGRIESRQVEGVSLLRTPLLRKISRYQTALLQAGVPASVRTSLKPGPLGGPFVPLSHEAKSETFEKSLVLLRSALTEEARLSRIIDYVPLRRPIESPLQVTSPFGARLDPFLGQAAMHTGMDLMEAYGAPVMATASGTVTKAGSEGGYGNMVEIDHGDGIATRYAHLSAVMVSTGEKVSTGAIIGRVGSTGRATGPHLHYETRVDGIPVDPERFLKAGANLISGEAK